MNKGKYLKNNSSETQKKKFGKTSKNGDKYYWTIFANEILQEMAEKNILVHNSKKISKDLLPEEWRYIA